MNLLAKNMGTVDRAARVALGLGLLSLTVIGPQTAWGLLGAVPLVTGAAGRCPFYSLAGLDSRRSAARTGA